MFSSSPRSNRFSLLFVVYCYICGFWLPEKVPFSSFGHRTTKVVLVGGAIVWTVQRKVLRPLWHHKVVFPSAVQQNTRALEFENTRDMRWENIGEVEPWINLELVIFVTVLLCVSGCAVELTVNTAPQLHTSGSRPKLVAEVLAGSSRSQPLSCLCWATFLYRWCLNRWDSSCSLCPSLFLPPCVSQQRGVGKGMLIWCFLHIFVCLFWLNAWCPCVWPHHLVLLPANQAVAWTWTVTRHWTGASSQLMIKNTRFLYKFPLLTWNGMETSCSATLQPLTHKVTETH